MITIKCLGSGSSGNCWIIKKGKETLILECGITFDEILRSREIDSWNDVVGCLCTHQHTDHCISKPNLWKLGIPIYDNLNLEIGKPIYIGSFKVKALPAYHNVDCISFLIKNIDENKTIFFVTDTTKIPKIKDRIYDLIMIETNWDEKQIAYQIENDTLENLGYKHHLSVQKVYDYINNRTKPKNLIATHLSTQNSLGIKETKEKLKGCCENIFIAQKGLKVEI